MISNDVPRVSIVVPVFNEHVEVLRQSFASIQAQTFSNFECLVIDESTDPTIAEACQNLCSADLRFKYIHPHQRLGLAASLNIGVKQARGEFIARFDADDICMVERLALQVNYLDENSDVGVVGGSLEIMAENGRTLARRYYPLEHRAIERRMQSTSAVSHTAVMIRRVLFELHGVYGPEFRFAEDLDLWLRFLNRGVRFANLSEVLVRYRQDSTVRSALHWHFNRRARLRNLHLRNLPLRLAGILAVTVWAWLPYSVQERVFKPLLLRYAR